MRGGRERCCLAHFSRPAFVRRSRAPLRGAEAVPYMRNTEALTYKFKMKFCWAHGHKNPGAVRLLGQVKCRPITCTAGNDSGRNPVVRNAGNYRYLLVN